MNDETNQERRTRWKPATRQTIRGSSNIQIGHVGAGAVVVCSTQSVVAPEVVQVDRRLVAETMGALSELDADQHVSVVAWMEREFGTQIVKGLSAVEHRRVRSYVAAVKGDKVSAAARVSTPRRRGRYDGPDST